MKPVTASQRTCRIAAAMLALFALVAPVSAQRTLTWDPNGVAPGTTAVVWDNAGVFQA